MSHTQVSRGDHADGEAAHALARIQDALHGLRYGSVTVTVQDGVVVQVERTEKLRIVRRE
ncbi:MAG TPA: YezD family protein [Candidatus Acidoferrales bacterium]|nr:YezD family protein [Candidatus Acidoferrales bacterium]